mmetsp:Transcript_4915/g.13996  ORF Transcript_4915/g.13996 Transcript_4915/m.13996 type:complete len:221 (+) Transcript_4915:402-1064(+)
MHSPIYNTYSEKRKNASYLQRSCHYADPNHRPRAAAPAERRSLLRPSSSRKSKSKSKPQRQPLPLRSKKKRLSLRRAWSRRRRRGDGPFRTRRSGRGREMHTAELRPKGHAGQLQNLRQFARDALQFEPDASVPSVVVVGTIGGSTTKAKKQKKQKQQQQGGRSSSSSPLLHRHCRESKIGRVRVHGDRRIGLCVERDAVPTEFDPRGRTVQRREEGSRF